MGMSGAEIGLFFGVAWVVFAIPSSIFLLRAYSRSKLSGLLWLFGAVIVWPFCARMLNVLVPAAAASQHLPFSSLLWINLASSVVTGVLLLIAVIVLDRELAQRLVQPQPAPPPKL